jgi:uncharacterized protein (TIGR02145 family)
MNNQIEKMKTALSILLICCLAVSGRAQDISVTFSASGSATKIDSVAATNLATDQSVTIPGDATLVLASNTGIQSMPGLSEAIMVYPNPFSGITTLNAVIPTSQIIEVKVMDLMARVLAQSRIGVQPGLHEFGVSVDKIGIYLVSIVTDDGPATVRILCSEATSGGVCLNHKGMSQGIPGNAGSRDLKSSLSSHTLGYTPGDVIHYRCMSGEMTTIVTDTLPKTGNYPVEFVSCQDEGGKNYPVVKIGSQTWMAENLAYLPEVSPGTEGSDTDPNYYVNGYQGSDLNEAMSQAGYRLYGVLYNWEAARVSCPAGWNLPSDDEWNIMDKYLGMSEEDANAMDPRNSGDVGRKLKSSKGWESNGNGDNSSGFTGVPGGIRNEDGAFYYLGSSAYFWTSSDEGDFKAWGRCLHFHDNGEKRGNTYRRIGFAVRCIRTGFQ